MQMLPFQLHNGKEKSILFPCKHWVSATFITYIPTKCIDKSQLCKTELPFILLHQFYIFFRVFVNSIDSQIMLKKKIILNSILWNKMLDKQLYFLRFDYDFSCSNRIFLSLNSILLNKTKIHSPFIYGLNPFYEKN